MVAANSDGDQAQDNKVLKLSGGRQRGNEAGLRMFEWNGKGGEAHG